jgi:hypothetical protein
LLKTPDGVGRPDEMENPLEGSRNWRLSKGPDGTGNPPVGAGKPLVGKGGRPEELENPVGVGPEEVGPEGIRPWGAGRARAQPIKPMRVKPMYFIVGWSGSIVYFVR